MKKYFLFCLCMFMLTGCGGSSTTTYFFPISDDTYGLFDENGKQINDNEYDSFEKVNEKGFIVTADEEVGYLSLKGKVLITLGEFSSLTVEDTFLLGEKEDGSKTLFDLDGKILYEDNEEVTITFDGVAIIKTEKEYSVLSMDGSVFMTSEEEVVRGDILSTYMFIQYKDHYVIYDIVTQDVILDVESDNPFHLIKASVDVGYILYSTDAKRVICYDYQTKEETYVVKEKFDSMEIDDMENVIGISGDDYFIISNEGEVQKLNSYYKNSDQYIIKNSEFIYGPHVFYNNGDTVEVTEIQLDPLASLTKYDIIPVYLKSKGYVYYNFKGKQAFDTIYKSASAFDENECAIVSKKENEYYLINLNEEQVSDSYVSIQHLEGIYYAAYLTNTKYEVISYTGEKIIDDTFTGSCEMVIYDEVLYGIFSKNGKSYVYEMIEKNCILECEGTVTVDNNGILVANEKTFYSFKGKEIYKK